VNPVLDVYLYSQEEGAENRSAITRWGVQNMTETQMYIQLTFYDPLSISTGSVSVLAGLHV